MKKKKKVYMLFTETVKNGVYSGEAKPYTEKQFKKMLAESSKNNEKIINKKK